jgi:hypothetical protein
MNYGIKKTLSEARFFLLLARLVLNPGDSFCLQ